jgi:transcriptional regulator with XRE-family HTH domain
MFPVGLAIAVYRSQKGITAKQVAKEIGVSRGFLSILELGLRLPPVSMDFARATANFLNVSETALLSSISCEHFLTSIKNFAWLSPLINNAISDLFTAHYFSRKGSFAENAHSESLYVLRPCDDFRAPILKHIIEKKLIPTGAETFIADEITLCSGEKTLGILKNVKPYLYKTSNLFSIPESLIFFDSFGVSSTTLSLPDEASHVFNFTFHTPLSAPMHDNNHFSVDVSINPFSSNPIDIFTYPITSFTKDYTREF